MSDQSINMPEAKCPECGDEMVITFEDGHEVAECGGCGHTETT